MHADEFLAEVIESPICPDNFSSIYHEFLEYQQLAINTLNEFHRVCEKNNVPYQLAFGSLLGAIRDDGPIPWDYDVDVWVPQNKVADLIKALEQDLSKDYYFYCPDSDPNCRHYMMRITPVGYRSEVLHVDVFYMIGAPANEEERAEFAREVWNVFHTRYYKLVKIRENYQGRLKHEIKLVLKKIQYLRIPIAKLDRQYNQLCGEYPFDEATYCLSFEDKIVSFIKNEFWDTKIINNSYGNYRITKHYEDCLNVLYKDYKQIPPLDERINDVLKYYDLLKLKSRIKKQ